MNGTPKYNYINMRKLFDKYTKFTRKNQMNCIIKIIFIHQNSNKKGKFLPEKMEEVSRLKAKIKQITHGNLTDKFSH